MLLTDPDKHRVVLHLEALQIPKKVMTYITNPNCDEVSTCSHCLQQLTMSLSQCCLFQSLKIVSNILEFAGVDSAILLSLFIELGLLPCLYRIIRSHRDINVIQQAIWCFVGVIHIDNSLRRAILVENGMLSLMLQVLCISVCFSCLLTCT